MSHFEYISVALALLYALVVGRVLTGLGPSLEHRRRYPIHVAWLVVFLFVSILQWWGMWDYKSVTWTPVRFLLVMSLPAILFLRAGILLGTNPDSVESFRSRFYEQRRTFFAVGLAEAVIIAFSPWVLGQSPWLTLHTAHRFASVLAILSVAGLALESSRAQAAIVIVALLLAGTGYYLLPG